MAGGSCPSIATAARWPHFAQEKAVPQPPSLRAHQASSDPRFGARPTQVSDVVVALHEYVSLVFARGACRARGVVLEEYDIPEIGLRTVNGVAEFDGAKVAWFLDTERNIVSLGTM